MTVSGEHTPPPEGAGDGSREPSRPWPDPEWDAPGASADWSPPNGLAFDDHFVRAGAHEPPARTRMAIARHDAELARQAAARARAAAPRRRLSASEIEWPPETTAEPTPAHRPQVWRRVVAVVVAFSLLCATVLGRFLPGGSTTAATGAQLTNDQAKTITGIAANAPAGTCYTIQAQTFVQVDLQSLPCSVPHSFELVSHATATDFPDYPSADYWTTFVAPACYADILDYVGKDRALWPAGLKAGYFRPSATSWTKGDRAVSCVTATPPSGVGSVYGS